MSNYGTNAPGGANNEGQQQNKLNKDLTTEPNNRI